MTTLERHAVPLTFPYDLTQPENLGAHMSSAVEDIVRAFTVPNDRVFSTIAVTTDTELLIFSMDEAKSISEMSERMLLEYGPIAKARSVALSCELDPGLFENPMEGGITIVAIAVGDREKVAVACALVLRDGISPPVLVPEWVPTDLPPTLMQDIETALFHNILKMSAA